MENKYFIDLKEQQSYGSKPYLVQGVFFVSYPVCVNVLSEILQINELSFFKQRYA